MAKSKSKYSFGEGINRAIEHEETRKRGFGYLKLPEDIKEFKNNTDQNKIDIIPYIITDENNPDVTICNLEIGQPWYRRPFYVHKNVGPNEETVVCPTTFGKKCPICEYVAKRKKEGAEYEDIKDLYRKLRYLYVVIPIDDEDHEEEMHVWDISDFLFERKLVDEIKKGNVDVEFASPVEGQTLKVRWIEEQFGKNKFGKAGAVDGLDRDPYDEKIIEDAPNLDEVLEVHSYKKLEMMFLDLEEADVEEDEVEKEKPVRKSYRTNRKEQEEQQEEEQQEETSNKRTYRKSSSVQKNSPKNKSSKKDECPHGYEFGVDTEEYEECEKCKVYDACLDAKLEK